MNRTDYEYAAQILHANAWILRAAKKYDEARKHYRQLIDEFPDTDHAAEARQVITKIEEPQKEEDTGRNNNKFPPFRLFSIACRHRAIENYSDARQLFAGIAELYPDTFEASHARQLIATIDKAPQNPRTVIVIQPQVLQINGRTLPDQPSLDDFRSLLGPTPRLCKTSYGYYWIWDERGVMVYGKSEHELRSLTICPRPAPQSVMDSGINGLESGQPCFGLRGELVIFGVSLLPQETPFSFQSRILKKKPDSIGIDPDSTFCEKSDDAALFRDHAKLGFLTAPCKRGYAYENEQWLHLGYWQIDASRFWNIVYEFVKWPNAPAGQVSSNLPNALMTCSACGKTLSRNAMSCPSCGEPNPNAPSGGDSSTAERTIEQTSKDA